MYLNVEEENVGIQYKILADVVQPPWCDVVEPDPNVPRERPDHPAPARTDRNAEEHQHDPRHLLLLVLTDHQEARTVNSAGMLRLFDEFLPVSLALTKREGIHTSCGNGLANDVQGAMNWK